MQRLWSGVVDLVQSAGVEPTANSTTDVCYQLQDPDRLSGNVSADRDQSNCVAVMLRDGRSEPSNISIVIILFICFSFFRKTIVYYIL